MCWACPTLVAPTPDAGQTVEPLAEVQMALRATFIPDEGFLGVEARLTSASFILSRNCHLTGGFAFYSWFSGAHAGDFVQTLGGYHPKFRAPGHYPRVPRLGFNWQVSPQLTVKGDAYYALTTHALMAGGHLEATWKDGSIQAWFKAGADFLISWKPYHYDIRITVDMGVSYTYHFFGTHHISVDLGAGLHIWGPDFSGQAHIKLWIVSFSVSFGAGTSQQPQPIAWDDPDHASFKPSFLPSDDAICGLSPQTGLTRTVEHSGQPTWVVNPVTFSLVSNSVIPTKHAWRHAQSAANALDGRLAGKAAETQFGIGSMEVAPEDLDTRLPITISRIDEADGVSTSTPVEAHFQFEPIHKNVPAGLWGSSLKPDLNGDALVDHTLAGFTIRPGAPRAPEETQPIDRNRLRYSTDVVEQAWQWNDIETFTAKLDTEGQRREQVRNSIVATKVIEARSRLLQALSIDPALDLRHETADHFLIAPQVEATERESSVDR